MDCFTTPSSLVFDSTGSNIVSAEFSLDEAAPSWGNPWIELNISNSSITGTMNNYAGGNTLAADRIPYQITLSNNSVSAVQK
jgi:hypothetical protein